MIQASQISKTYRLPNEEAQALKSVDFSADEGEFVAVMGPSGAGKTTLLNIIGGLDAPTSGTAQIDGREWGRSDRARTKMRRELTGFVFQEFHLIPSLTARENVALPLFFSRKFSRKQEEDAAARLLREVGLEDRIEHRPSELSGGEMQRVAIARALVNNPKTLLADEPTGNLDVRNSKAIFNLFRELADAQGLTVVAATHNPRLAALADRAVYLRGGTVESERRYR